MWDLVSQQDLFSQVLHSVSQTMQLLSGPSSYSADLKHKAFEVISVLKIQYKLKLTLHNMGNGHAWQKFSPHCANGPVDMRLGYLQMWPGGG